MNTKYGDPFQSVQRRKDILFNLDANSNENDSLLFITYVILKFVIFIVGERCWFNFDGVQNGPMFFFN